MTKTNEHCSQSTSLSSHIYLYVGIVVNSQSSVILGSIIGSCGHLGFKWATPKMTLLFIAEMGFFGGYYHLVEAYFQK